LKANRGKEKKRFYYCTFSWYFASVAKFMTPEDVKSTDEPLKRTSCFPAGKGFQYYPKSIGY
jgi:hypothetical protein